MRDLRDELRAVVELRVGRVDALAAVLRHQDRLGVDLERAQCGGGVGREERVAGAGGEDHDARLLEVAHRAPPDVGLRDLGDRDRALHARVHEDALEGGAVHGRYAPTAKRAKRRITTFSPVVPESSARSCSIVLPSCLSGLTCSCLSSTTSSIHLRSLPSAILARTFSGLSEACCSKTRSSASLASSGTSSSETYLTV